MTKIIITLMLNLSFTFFITSHPIMMILNLIILTILSSLLTTLFMKISWFSYILFLIMLGGMLVVFIYITSLAPNEPFKLSLITMILMTSSFPLVLSSYNYMFHYKSTMFKLSITNMFSSLSLLTTILLVSFLLITLIAVVKISKISQGPIQLT
ncbi:NADH dehydrogenase subunit 6 (mitochondrion) [Tachypleus tridentatus]|uniref:NADH-ubiquinone oxidoreductase chain 6 n=1 Tax=Tachypleus tridentatus TaxID=6853 RepID=C1KRK2_TACTR|nr:NADH dehydrogenase subunit 6 [Tachypleus tridentatus]ACO52908.1 NADH dehydrogenase subunit 6 [Tachypleus tridentatus]